MGWKGNRLFFFFFFPLMTKGKTGQKQEIISEAFQQPGTLTPLKANPWWTCSFSSLFLTRRKVGKEAFSLGSLLTQLPPVGHCVIFFFSPLNCHLIAIAYRIK